jgi:hypothetical protein
VIIGFNQKYFRPQFINFAKVTDYIGEEATKWKISKISDEYLPKDFPIPKSYAETGQDKFRVADGIIVESNEVKSHLINLTVSATNPDEILFNIAYFPGWSFVVDGVRVIPEIRKGKPVVHIPEGRHAVSAYFTDTPVRKLGNWISMTGVISLLIAIKRKSKFIA